jgi:hypothetical protein
VVQRQPLRHLDQVAAHRVQALADQQQNDQAGGRFRESVFGRNLQVYKFFSHGDQFRAFWDTGVNPTTFEFTYSYKASVVCSRLECFSK